MNGRIVSIVATAVSILALTALVINHGLFTPSLTVIGVQTLAVLLMIWARLTFGIRSFHAAANPTAGGLVTRGPYKYVRHPIYAAVVVFVAVGVMANLSLRNVVLGLIVVAGMVMRALCEERLLHVQYPEYVAYARRTWRMIPYVF